MSSWSRSRSLAAREREATAQLIASIAELDARRLYLGRRLLVAVHILHAVLAFVGARGLRPHRGRPRGAAMADHPRAALGGGHHTHNRVPAGVAPDPDENHQAVLEAAKHKSKREVEQQVAALRPLPAVPSIYPEGSDAAASDTSDDVPGSIKQPTATVARCPTPAFATEAPMRPGVSGRPPVVSPLAPDRYKVQFTVTRETHDKLRQVQDLLRHSVPDGDPAAIFDRALTLLLAELRKRKFAVDQSSAIGRQSRPRPRAISRHCKARGLGTRWRPMRVRGNDQPMHRERLSGIPPLIPFAAGGPTTSANLELRCRAHNAHEASEYFGVHEDR